MEVWSDRIQNESERWWQVIDRGALSRKVWHGPPRARSWARDFYNAAPLAPIWTLRLDGKHHQ
jgi:hypothetical protein